MRDQSHTIKTRRVILIPIQDLTWVEARPQHRASTRAVRLRWVREPLSYQQVAPWKNTQSGMFGVYGSIPVFHGRLAFHNTEIRKWSRVNYASWDRLGLRNVRTNAVNTSSETVLRTRSRRLLIVAGPRLQSLLVLSRAIPVV